MDPANLYLAIGAVIEGRTEIQPRIVQHLRQFGEKGSPTASALAEGMDGVTRALRLIGCSGLIELLSHYQWFSGSVRS